MTIEAVIAESLRCQTAVVELAGSNRYALVFFELRTQMN